MNMLWQEKTDYRWYNPESERDQCDFLEYPPDFLPYKRLYENLSQEELLELIHDARRFRWPVLDLRDCGLASLPEELGYLPDLRGLWLGDYQYEYEDFSVYGSRNPFTTLPDSIGKLTKLQSLDLCYTDITAIPDSIGSLSMLKSLDLSGTDITALPDSIASLSKLQSLDLSETDITALPASIASLTKLQSLDLRETNIIILPDFISSLSKLQSLDLGWTRITALPDSIGKLRNLKTLKLNSLHLSSLPYGVVQLGLPFVTNDHSADNCINLTGVTLDEGDITLFSRPRDVIEANYRDRVEGLNQCKVIFLGDGEAGKTSLIERIENDTYQDKAFPTTHGIKMTKWTRKPDGTPLELNGEPLIIRFLDFGGQEIMHAMHRCFLTNHTVYVVVCASRDDAEIDRVAARWMETVKTFAPECPVILALNKYDDNQNAGVYETKLREINPNFRLALHTSAKSGYGMEQLTEAILREVPSCLNLMKGNAGYLGLKQALEDMEEPYIEPDKFQKLCEKHKIPENQRSDVLDWFWDLGVAYPYFISDLRRVHVLNPAWLTNGIYYLILQTPDEDGFLSHRTIRETLGKPDDRAVNPNIKYTAEETEYILYIMRTERFQISLETRKGPDGEEMIPMKMKKDPPKETYAAFPKEDALHLRWEAGYLPNNVVHRLLIRRYSELDRGCVWLTGGLFHENGCHALVEQTEQTIDVYVAGDGALREYMNVFGWEILNIVNELGIDGVKESICYTKDGVTDTVDYQVALYYYGMGVPVFFPKIRLPVPADELLKNNYLPSAYSKLPSEDRIAGRANVTINHFSAPVGQVNHVEGSGNTFHQREERR